MWLKFPQVAEPDPSLAADEADDVSSYGTGHSSEGFMERTRLAVAASEGADIETLFAAIATFSRGQSIVIEKLALLEKVVGTVQFDMTWVRDDMKSVHQVMERIAGHVCNIKETTAEAERLREQVSVDASPPQPCRGKASADDFEKAPSASTTRGEQQRGDDELPNWNADGNEVGSYVEEPVALMLNPVTNMNSVTSPAGGRGDWGYPRVTSPAVTSPLCQQPRVGEERDALEAESQQIQMSCHSTQIPTPLTGRTMWQDFTAAVRDWPPPTMPAMGTEEGWVTTKRGRWDTMDYGKGGVAPERAAGILDFVPLNLNALLETHVGATGMRGGRDVELSKGIAGASNNAGSGTGRGSGRGKRLPEVQPRYHTPVRHPCFFPLSAHVFAVAQVCMYGKLCPHPEHTN